VFGTQGREALVAHRCEVPTTHILVPNIQAHLCATTTHILQDCEGRIEDANTDADRKEAPHRVHSTPLRIRSGNLPPR
jgi:hypothetical protein